MPRTILGLTWRQHIGGRWAVSPLGFAIISPIAFLAVLRMRGSQHRIDCCSGQPSHCFRWAL